VERFAAMPPHQLDEANGASGKVVRTLPATIHQTENVSQEFRHRRILKFLVLPQAERHKRAKRSPKRGLSLGNECKASAQI
jgi:hypothetical protein